MENDKNQEEFRVNGSEIVEKVKELIRKGNARRIIITDEKGERLLSIPITVGAVGVLVAPVAAALGALAALVTKCTIIVERNEEK